MKMRNSARASVTGKKRTARAGSHQAIEGLNLPRLFLFLEVFVDKEIPSSTK